MPIDPITASLLASGGAGLLDSLFGGGDTMSPEAREVLRLLKGKLGVARNVQGQIDATTQQFKDYATDTTASAEASAARRGVPLSMGQRSLQQADITGRVAKGLSTAIPEIQRNAKNEELGILSTMAGLAPPPQNTDISGPLSDFASNLAYYYMNKGQGGSAMPNNYNRYNMRPKFKINLGGY